MFSFEYTIELNEHGRPYIVASPKTKKELDFLEHKFMGLELARALVLNTIHSHVENPEKFQMNESELDRLKNLNNELLKICDIFAHAIKDQMEVMEVASNYQNPQVYDMQVLNDEELHALNYNGIIYGELILKRVEGLKVKVLSSKKIYALRGGIDNINWIDVTNE